MLGYPSYGDRRSYASRGAKRYSSDMIAYAWRDQESPSGKCPASMTFDGGKFYSYATVIAERLEYNGKTLFLVSDESYSCRTGRHLSQVRCALGSRPHVFTVPGVVIGNSDLADLPRIFHSWQSRAQSKLEEAGNAPREITRSRLIVEAYQIVCQMRTLAEFFHESLDGYPVRLPMPSKTCVDAATFTGIAALKHLDPSPWMRHPEAGVMYELPAALLAATGNA